MKNKDIKNIIVGVDLSPYSKVVVQQAQLFSDHLKIPMTIVHVNSEFWPSKNYPDDLYIGFDRKIRSMYSLKKDTKIVIKFGKAAEELIRVAKKTKKPMIVVGHKGHNTLSRVFFGSTADSVAQASPFPVWIHREEKTIVPKKFLVPTDLTKRSDYTIKKADPFSRQFGGKIELYHVQNEPPLILDYTAWTILYEKVKKDEAAKLNAFTKKYPGVKVSQTSGNISGTILKYSNKFDVIVVTPSHEDTDLPIFGSVTSHLIRSGEKPILIFP